MSGKVFDLLIEPTETIERIKERVEEVEGLPLDQQRLICNHGLFGGLQMEDKKTAQDYNLEEGCLIYLLLRLRGS